MGLVEPTFEAIIAQLDGNHFQMWSSVELNLFISLIKAYHTQLRRSRNPGSTALSTSPEEGSKHVKPCEHSESGVACDSATRNRRDRTATAVNTREHGIQNAASMIVKGDLLSQEFLSTMGFPSEDQVAEVDRSLTRVRHYLQEKYPLGTLNEPSYTPYNNHDRCASSQKHLHAVKHMKPHDGNPQTCGGKHERCCFDGEERGDMNNAVISSSLIESEPGRFTDALVPPPVCVVDAFLYNAEDIDTLAAESRLCREYCRRCGSTAIGLVDFITHSFSPDQLVYLSCFLVPALVGGGMPRPRLAMQAAGGREGEDGPMALVDVGSRLGVVLWAMYFAAKAGVYGGGGGPSGDPVEGSLPLRVFGVERDPHFASIQRELRRRYCAQPFFHLDVVESDCFEGEGAAALQSSDFIVLHNVFEYFSESPKEHFLCWKKLRDLVRRPGQILICSPKLEETFASFDAIDGNCFGEFETTSLLSSKTSNDGKNTITRHKNRSVNLEDGDEKPSKRPRTDLPIKKEFSNTTGNEKANRSWQKEWIDTYVERVNVDEITERFLAFRMKSQTSSRDADSCAEEPRSETLPSSCALDQGFEEHRSRFKQLEDASSCPDSIQLELDEQVRNIFVYRVK